MDYIPFSPSSRDEQNAFLERSDNVNTIIKHRLTLIAAGPGSGKTNNGKSIAMKMFEDHKFPVTFLVAHADGMINQHEANYKKDGFITVSLKDSKGKFKHIGDFIAEVEAVLLNRKPVVVIVSGITHHNGKFSNTASVLGDIMRAMKAKNMVNICQIDEFDDQLTSLTGGINASIQLDDSHLTTYAAVIEQKASLNFFDVLREVDATVIGWSGTMNNVICSKMPSIGYHAAETLIINIAPIPSLYSTKKFIMCDLGDENTYVPQVHEITRTGGIVNCVFPTVAKLKKFEADHPNVNIVAITNETPRRELEFDALSQRLTPGTIVCSVNMMCSGFDVASFTNGINFSGNFILRNSSDISSQPLSRNKYNILHCSTSALINQTASRSRDPNAPIYVPKSHATKNMLSIQQRVYEIIELGAQEGARYGPMGTTQKDRMHHLLYTALCQNIQASNTPTVNEIVDGLNTLTGRDFLAEIDDDDRDHLLWRNAIGVFWQNACLPTIGKKSGRYLTVLRLRGTCVRGGGSGQLRTIDAAVQALVNERARGRCAHCGERLDPDNRSIQDAHMKRHEQGGPYSTDNIMKSHGECDAMFDASRLIHDPDNTHYWLYQTLNWEPHVKQVRAMNRTYLCDRWLWAKKQICPDSTNMRAWLAENGWRCCTYDD